MSTPTLKGPYWVTVRQYRRTVWLAGAAVVLALAVVGALRIWDAQTPDQDMGGGNWIPSYENKGFRALQMAMESGGTGMLLLPLLAGAFVAGPLIAREYESGTYQLSLTQSVSPAAWLRAKLVTATVVAVLTTLALMGVFRLGWSRMASSFLQGWDPGPYAATGIVLPASVLAAVAVGALVGQLVRRTLVAMALTGLVMGVVMLVLGAFRWSLLPVRTVTAPTGEPLWGPPDALVMESGLLTASGARFDERICWDRANATPGTDTQEGLWAKVEAQCHTEHGVTTQYVDYHPVSHYWPTQFIETGILLALAALALYAAVRVLRARHP